MPNNDVINKVKEALISAANTFKEGQKKVYFKAIENETESRAKWIMENTLENEKIAKLGRFNLCDDSGIPHLLLEVGKNIKIDSELLDDIHEGVAMGLRELPARPMAVLGDDFERIEQSKGLDPDPGALVPGPISLYQSKIDGMKLHILLQGGGPEIRARTYRVFHKRSIQVIVDEIVEWAKEEVGLLGCTPVVPAIGIGRSHYEASSLMLQAMVDGNFEIQNDVEKEITRRINETNVGPLGLKGDTTALASFIKVGPQRGSGVRIVSLRLCCNIEPRVASVKLQ